MVTEEIQNGNSWEPTNNTKQCESESKAMTPPIIDTSMPTIGRHLTQRLVQLGVTDVFSVPGDFNLTLLDFFVAQPGLNLIGCCNELNCGYATDGYARSRGISACVVTFTVGGLSILNAIAGAYSADLPVICIVGGPHSKEYSTKKILHHTIGLPDFTQELKCYQAVTCHQAVIDDLGEAQEKIDKAITICLKESKPVYISVSCDLVAIPHSTFNQTSTPLFLPPKMSDEMVLEAAVEATAEFLNKAVKPVMVGGPKLQVAKACDAVIELAEACGYALAVMPGAKGLLPENHPQFIGVYWGVVSSDCCGEIVDIADASLFAGPSFDETNTVNFTLIFQMDKAIVVEPERVLIPNRPAFRCILMKDFLKALAKRLNRNTTAIENYKRIYVPEGEPVQCDPKETLKVNILFNHVQKMLSSDMAVIVEAGDSWFHCQKLKLPQSCRYQCQLLYASIGWSVGATLGYAQAASDKRVVSCIGDGSFQMTAQEVSTMLRLGQKNIIFLLNNGGYTIEVVIHDGPYNVIKNWNYTGFVEALDNGEGNCWTAKVRCEEELVAAIEMAMGDKKDCLCFIEVIVHRDDTSKELLEFGCKVSRQPMSAMSK